MSNEIESWNHFIGASLRTASFSRRTAPKLVAGLGIGSMVRATLDHAVFARQSFPIQPASAELPSSEVTVRVLVQGTGPRSAFYREFFPAYESVRSNVTIESQELPANEIQKVLPLAVQNGNAADVFMLGGALTTAQAVTAGWVAPLDDIIPNFEAWKANFPPGVFLEGITTFGGKTFTFPLSSNQRYGTMVFFHDVLMQQAGLEIPETVMTWTQFRDMARKLTEAGKGSSYGLILGGKDSGRLEEIVTNFAAMAGAVGSNTLGGPMNWLTGEYSYVTDEFLAAVELLLAMNSDGSIFPGSLSLSQPDADARMSQGMAAMTLDGPWLIDRWQEEAPDLQYSLGSQPIREGIELVPLGFAPGGANPHFVYSESPVKEIAGDMIAQWGTPEGQQAFQRIVGGALRAILPGAAVGVEIDEPSRKALGWFDEQMRLHPDPRPRNADVATVYLEEQRLQPTFGEVIQGLMTGQLSDPKAALQDLQDRANAELDRAIKAAQDKGAQVSREDWVFPNWDPAQDYTEEMYAAL